MKKISNFLSDEVKNLKAISGGYQIGTRSNTGSGGTSEENGWSYDTTDTETNNQQDVKLGTESGNDAPDFEHSASNVDAVTW